jgi:hypothetical protein
LVEKKSWSVLRRPKVLIKRAKQIKAKDEDSFDVPFDLVVASGFGSGPGVRAWA